MNAIYSVSLSLRRGLILGAIGLGTVAMLGCDGTPALIPNNDPALRKSSAAFAADAARRHYEADAPKATDNQSRAQYELIVKQLDLANVSDQDWTNVEVWINGRYVVFLPKLEKKTDKTLNFQMFFDDQGEHFSTDSGKNPIKTVELYRNGTMYLVPDHVAD